MTQGRGGKASGDLPSFADLMADDKPGPARPPDSEERGADAGGCRSCLLLIVLLLAAVAFLDPGLFDRVRGVSPQPAAQVSARATVTVRATATARLTATAPPAATVTPELFSALFDNVVARACPRLDCDVLGRFGRGAPVALTGEIRGEPILGNAFWYRVVLPDAPNEAYVHSSLLAPPTPTAPPTATPTATRNATATETATATVTLTRTATSTVTRTATPTATATATRTATSTANRTAAPTATVTATRTATATRTPRPSATPRLLNVLFDGVLARACPRRDCEMLARLTVGMRLTVLGATRGEEVQGSTLWHRVALPDAPDDAYVHASLLAPLTSTPAG